MSEIVVLASIERIIVEVILLFYGKVDQLVNLVFYSCKKQISPSRLENLYLNQMLLTYYSLFCLSVTKPTFKLSRLLLKKHI